MIVRVNAMTGRKRMPHSAIRPLLKKSIWMPLAVLTTRFFTVLATGGYMEKAESIIITRAAGCENVN